RRRRHTSFSRDWSSDVCSSDLTMPRHSTAAAILCACLILPGEAGARPLHYTLDPATSEVRFAIDLTQGGDIRGRMPVAAAALTLDFEAAAQSRVQVTLDPAHARTNLPFATQAMKGPEVLDTGAHPQIRFESTRVRADGDGAIIDGQVTIRGVTRPITLAARIYRPK